jgi:molybdopterin molybdotransferase
LMGCEVVETLHVLDHKDTTNDAIEKAFDGRCDLVVTIGGISAGKRDFFPGAFEHAGVELVVKGANVQPGKPVIVGTREKTILLGLPGNPVSALACCCIFGWPIVRGLLGCKTSLPWQSLPLASATKPNPKRTVFRPCVLKDGKINIPQWQGSGDLAHTATTNGLVQLPPFDGELEVGTFVSYLPYPW